MEEIIRKICSEQGFKRINPFGLKDSAVMLPIIYYEGGLSILFEVRTREIAQGGEICFPGGRIETGETPQDAALRETVEELCINRPQIMLLSPLFTTTAPGGGTVYSFLGRIENYEDTWSENEVERTFALSLEWLLSCRVKVYDTYVATQAGEDFPYDMIPGGRRYGFRRTPKRIYFYETDYGVIWGLTAELLFEFLSEIRKIYI